MAVHSTGILWFVLPTLPMFLIFPWLLRRGMGFWPSRGLGCLSTPILYLVTARLLLKQWAEPGRIQP